MKYGIVCRLEAPAVSLSFGPTTATHNSGAGAPRLPQLPEGQRTAKGASCAPTEGSRYSAPGGLTRGMLACDSCMTLFENLGRSRKEHLPAGDPEA